LPVAAGRVAASAGFLLGRIDKTPRRSCEIRRGSINTGLSTPAHAWPCIAAMMAA